MRRERGLIKTGLKALGYLKFKEQVAGDYVFQCLKCEIDLFPIEIMRHFITCHKEVYNIIKSLTRAWGLIGDEPVSESDLIDPIPS